MKGNISNNGGFLVFLGAFFWSLNAPLVVFLQLNPLFMCGMRGLVAAVVLLPFLRPKRLQWNRWMILYLFSFMALCVSLILALKMTASTIAIGMQYTAAVWLFLAGVIQHERPTLRTAAPVALIFLGILLFMSTGIKGGNWTGNLIALSEGVFFALMTVSSKKAAGTNPIGLTALASLFTGLFVFVFLPPSFRDFAALSGMEWGLMLILGIVQMGAGYSFYNMGLCKTTSQKASILALWEMILGPVWVALFLHEYPSAPVLAGFVVILLGMLLGTLFSAGKKSEAGQSSSLRQGVTVLTVSTKSKNK